MTWGRDSEIYDDIERSNLPLIRARLERYLEFHTANRGHLPANFQDATSRRPLDSADPRVEAFNKIGYYNYSVLVDLILVYREYKAIPIRANDVLDVYWGVSRFFTRLGAAIDKASFLAKAVELDFDRGKFSPHPIGKEGASVGKELRDRLTAADKYNNAVKHHGLPALMLKMSEGGDSATLEVFIPDNFSPGQVGWAAQTPRERPLEVCKIYQKTAFAAFDNFFAVLATDAPTMHARWNLSVAPAVQGIVTLSGPTSGSLRAVPDGYISTCSQALLL